MSRAPVAGVQDPGAEPVCLTLTCSRHSLLKELFAEFEVGKALENEIKNRLKGIFE